MTVDVRKLLEGTAASMWATFTSSSASRRPDHKGGPREKAIREFLSQRLPSKWGVTRGHVIFSGDRTTAEFDLIVYDAVNCPSWTVDDDSDPRRLVPLEAVVGIVEVKSTLNDATLNQALNKLDELDEVLRECELEVTYRPFRYLFAYRLDEAAKFGGWSAPHLMLTKYAGARTRPDGLFVLDSYMAVLHAGDAIGRAMSLLRGKTLDHAMEDSWEVQSEMLKRDVQIDPSYCNDYFCNPARNGFLLLSFLTFILDHASKFSASGSNYADLFCRWGGPALGDLFES